MRKVIVTFPAVQLFLLLPLELYTNNLAELQITLAEFLEVLLLPTLSFSMMFFLLLRVAPITKKDGLIYVMAGLTAAIWVQSNLLLWDYGVLDGRAIDWKGRALEGLIDLVLWVMIAIATYRFYKVRSDIFLKAVTFLFLVQSVSAGALVVSVRGHLPVKQDFASEEALSEMFNFSETDNIIHIVVDGFQADVFEYLVTASPDKSIYQDTFSGFVFYNETMGTFPFTRFSVPSFLAERVYDNQSKKEDFIESVFKGETLFSVARENGFDVDIASGAIYFVKKYAKSEPDNIYSLDAYKLHGGELIDALMMLDLSIFNAAPTLLKKYLYNDQRWFVSTLVTGENLFKYWYFSHTAFLHNLAEQQVVERKRPVYKYFHIMNTHNPMVVDRNCGYAGKVLRMTRKTLTHQSKCTMDSLSYLLIRLRESGIYDDALIVIHGDHGGWIGNRRQEVKIVFEGGFTAPDYVASLASPLLAIKLPGSSEGFSISDSHISLQQLPSTIASIKSWQHNFESMSIIDGQPEARYFNYYLWQKDAWESDYAGPIQVFKIEGSHYKSEWQREKELWPPD